MASLMVLVCGCTSSRDLRPPLMDNSDFIEFQPIIYTNIIGETNAILQEIQ